MLETVKFNKVLYRYREEDDKTLLLYNLRNGAIYFLTGEANSVVQKFNDNELIEVSDDNKIIQFLKMINVIENIY